MDRMNLLALQKMEIFLGLELIAKFDPFMADHLARYGNKGRGVPFYLSSTILDEFILQLSDLLKNKTVTKLKQTKYYSIIVDSTSDISHSDQLTFVIRYVLPDGTPVERFISFIPNASRKAQSMEGAVLSTLGSLNIDLGDCRGQSYDNAANMSGTYNGL
jgi:hypothetical protein